MSADTPVDVIVVGSGPNGLAAAITVARAGHSVRVYEAEDTFGGGVRSAALTRPGFVHDIASTVHAIGLLSPFFKSLPLADLGVAFAQPDIPFAHPLDDGTSVLVHRSVDETASALDAKHPHDARAYRRLFAPHVAHADALMEALLAPPGFRHPLIMASFGRHAIRSVQGLANGTFQSERSRALLAGAAAHSMVPLDKLATAGYALGLIVAAHAVGWPVVRGGSQQLANAMVAYLQTLGGEVVTGERVQSLAQLPASRAVLCDITPRQLVRMAGDRMPAGYRRRLERYRYGPGVFKMDWALSAPVPWRDAACHRAGTLHLGGTMAEIAHSERHAWEGRVSDHPYVLAVQASCFDASRVPSGMHSLWAYCHVPNASTVDMRERIESQVERFAPGFRDCIVERHATTPAALEQGNANLVGGDIAGGAADLAQVFTRPVASFDPHATPMKGVYLCSSSTPPGVGVHGMCGYLAARSALAQSLS